MARVFFQHTRTMQQVQDFFKSSNQNGFEDKSLIPISRRKKLKLNNNVRHSNNNIHLTSNIKARKRVNNIAMHCDRGYVPS